MVGLLSDTITVQQGVIKNLNQAHGTPGKISTSYLLNSVLTGESVFDLYYVLIFWGVICIHRMNEFIPSHITSLTCQWIFTNGAHMCTQTSAHLRALVKSPISFIIICKLTSLIF